MIKINLIPSEYIDKLNRRAIIAKAAAVGVVLVASIVLLSLWQLGMESLQLSGLSALDRVKASGRPSSALGEGFADALNVGGI